MKSIRSLLSSVSAAAAAAAFAALCALPASAAYNSMGVPDSSQIRREIAETWLHQPLKVLRGRQAEVHSNSIGQKFQVWLEESKSSYSVIVAPEVSLSYGSGEGTMTVSDFLPDSCGAWMLERSSSTGKPVRIRWYFVQDGDVYVQFSPDPYGGKKTLADYVVGGCFAARNVPVGLSFDRLYTASFADILALTEKTLPWRYAEIHTGQYANKILMMRSIRRNLDRISLEKNASCDEDGNPVHTFDGSARDVASPADGANSDKPRLALDSNGFVKWIIDGLVYPLSGSGTRLPPLLRRTVSVNPLGYAGVRGQAEDLTFSLDWTRNLAAARLSVQTKKKYLYEKSGVDVKIEPFSSELTSGGIANLAGYLKDSGYSAKYLQQVLYVLGVTEPTYFYLAAVRKSVRPGKNPEPGMGAEIFTFEDSAVIFPYFDESGRFACTVFYEGKELSLGAFLAECGECYVHLVRVLASDRFTLR